MNVVQMSNILDAVPPCFSAIGDDQCTGCSACANGCPQCAINMGMNKEGFYRPFLQKGLCNDCMACLSYCPVIASTKQTNRLSDIPDVYAAWSSDKGIHLSSSSGGLFSELARHVLDNAGVVCGCEWGDNWAPRHVIVEDWADVSKLRGSKYLPSFIDNRLYREIIGLAKAGKTVLFCGTPCQVAGLSLITPLKIRKNIILVDLVCHGVPSLTSFWSYLRWKFGKQNSLLHFSFRNKEISTQTICAFTKTGEKYLMDAGQDIWFRSAMVHHLFLQKSCFNCRFGGIPRWGDITLGDYWGIPGQWHNPLGDSVVLANTERGKDILSQLIRNECIKVEPSDYPTASRKIGRLRGSVYPLPIIRKFSLQLISENRSFVWFLSLCYLPIKFRERLSSAKKKIERQLTKLWGQCSA
jgi:coenzyme F420-reducing hydrogenase beta subunit